MATVQVTDNCPGVSFALTSVTSNEPDNGLGDGDTVGDIQDAALGTPDTQISLRAERQGSGDGRIYMVTYTARTPRTTAIRPWPWSCQKSGNSEQA